jgi:hypothetical protein
LAPAHPAALGLKIITGTSAPDAQPVGNAKFLLCEWQRDSQAAVLTCKLNSYGQATRTEAMLTT